MPSDTPPPVILARLIDAPGREVTAVETRPGTLAILTRSPEKGLEGGHPALSEDNARVLGTALLDFADRETS